MRIMKAVLCLILLLSLFTLGAADDDIAVDVTNASFDTVWQTVNENHFDSTFGGMDWNEVHTRYRAKLPGLEDDAEFIELMNDMLMEFGLSHYAVFRTRDKAKSGSPILSEGSLGLDIRLLDGRAVVNAVRDGFPAAAAGLRLGFIIESIDGEPVGRIIEKAGADLPPHLNDRARLNTIADKIINRFFGDPGTAVKLTYRDAADASHTVTLEMKAQPGKTILSDDFPPLYVDFASKRLPGDIGYVTFSAFLPPVAEKFIAAIDSMPGLRGIIIDIRGNPGGDHTIGEAIASKLVHDAPLFSVFKYRNETKNVKLEPNPPIFDGPVVILIDGLNGSASERFSACMQSIGRAVIIGERSPGVVGPSDIKALPNGASFMYLVAQSLTPDGTVLEGHGVIPDITVGLDREKLLRGEDTQLQRAVEYITTASE